MIRPNPFSSATLHHVASLISRSPLWRGFPVVLLVLGLFALSPTARAVNPPPDGGYPGNNTAEGDNALFNLTSGTDNTAMGFDALYSNTTGAQNIAIGVNALSRNTVAQANTAIGWNALSQNMGSAGSNTAIGWIALASNTSGQDNTAVGAAALQNNTNGTKNTACGVNALAGNPQSGNGNTATGSEALSLNTTGDNNTANGVNALFSNTTGQGNTASGFNALKSNTTAFNNTANGQGSLQKNTAGGSNTADGFHALLNNTTGSTNIALGATAGTNLTTGSDNIDIGNPGVAGEGNKIRIGKPGTQTATFIAGIRGVTVASGIGVIIGPNGQLGTVQSSARYKEAIQPMDKASEALLALKPVTFHYKPELDPDAIPQFGLLAEDVEKVNPDLVVRDENGKVMTVHYEAVNAMLLNEFLKEHRKVEEQGATIAQQQKQIEALTAAVQKVSNQIALSKPAPQLVTNP